MPRVGTHKFNRPGTEWHRLDAYEVVEGQEMELTEIAEVAGVSRQRIHQVFDVALRKFARRAAVARLREVLG